MWYHLDKREKESDPCSAYKSRYVKEPPFSCLSLDAETFMCNWGCSIVTQDRQQIVKHLLDEHSDELEKWCMKEELLRATLKHYEKGAEK